MMYSKAREAYIECQQLLSVKMTSKLASYNYPLMTVGVLLLLLVRISENILPYLVNYFISTLRAIELLLSWVINFCCWFY